MFLTLISRSLLVLDETCIQRLGPAFTVHGFHGLTAKGEDIIDWILCRLPAGKVQKVRVVDFHKDGRYPSDHFPVYADIELWEASASRVTIDSFEVSRESVDTDEPFEVSVLVKNQGEALGSIKLVLYIDGKPIDTRDVFVKGGQSKRITFILKLYEPGEHKITIDSLAPKTVKVRAGAPF